jgi:hypothetical protein
MKKISASPLHLVTPLEWGVPEIITLVSLCKRSCSCWFLYAEEGSLPLYMMNLSFGLQNIVLLLSAPEMLKW